MAGLLPPSSFAGPPGLLRGEDGGGGVVAPVPEAPPPEARRRGLHGGAGHRGGGCAGSEGLEKEERGRRLSQLLPNFIKISGDRLTEREAPRKEYLNLVSSLERDLHNSEVLYVPKDSSVA